MLPCSFVAHIPALAQHVVARISQELHRGHTSHRASRRAPHSTTFVLAGFFRYRSKALAMKPPTRCVPKVLLNAMVPAFSSWISSLQGVTHA